MNSLTVPAPRIVIAATSSGSGKTTLTCGILAALARRSMNVRAYKTGPDYIDPGYLAKASGHTAHNLDTWLTGEKTALRLFTESSRTADLSVIEGVMGLYDGGEGGISSTADIALKLNAPVVLVIDAKSMADSAAALALGFREYDRRINLCGVILNRLGSDNHGRIISRAMERIGIPVLGMLRRDTSFTISERHLGLCPATENTGCSFDHLAHTVEQTVDLDALCRIARSAPPLTTVDIPPANKKTRAVIGVARDEAFSFYYPQSLAELTRAGAEIVYFSPLRDHRLPKTDGLIFGGGFPEMFASALADNTEMTDSVRAACASGMPIYAECGGYMYLTRGIRTLDGTEHPMAGCIPGHCVMHPRLRSVGYIEATALSDTPLAAEGETIRGHEFHFSSFEGELTDPAWSFLRRRTGAVYPAGYAKDNILASYLHIHLAGYPQAAERFVTSCTEFRKKH